MKIAISTTTFGAEDPSPLEYLKKKGYVAVLNPHKRQVTSDELVVLAQGACGLIAGTEKITDAAMAQLPSLKVISRCGAGGDNVDAAAARKRGIKVFTTPDAPTTAVAELTAGLILGLARAIPLADRLVRSGAWKKHMGSLVSGKRAGIIGYGRIGKKVGELLSSLGCDVVYCDINMTAGNDIAGKARRISCEELLKTCDIVTIHASGTGGAAILDDRAIALMKRGAFLVNTSRGTAIDETALYRALKDGRLAGAALDVFGREPYDGPLKELDNVILTPHVGSYAREARIAMEMEAAANLVHGLEER
jgi:D-3-phosphoglycerate dehydrogenase